MTHPEASSATSEWFTPLDIIARVHRVIGYPDLDPASCAAANERVKAKVYFDQNGAHELWGTGSVFCNPPSGRRVPQEFWESLILNRRAECLTHAIWIAFNISHLRTCEGMAEFPLVIPYERIRFDRPDGTPGEAPTKDNAIIYVPGTVDRRELFFEAFGDMGAMVNR